MHVEKIHNKLIEKCLNKSIKFGTYLAILFTVQIAYTKTNRLFLKPNPIYKEDSTSFYKEDAYVLMSGNAVKRSHSLLYPPVSIIKAYRNRSTGSLPEQVPSNRFLPLTPDG